MIADSRCVPLFVVTCIIVVLATCTIWIQPLQVLTHRTTEGLSLLSVLMRLWSGAAWCGYGFANHENAQILVNGQSIVATLVLLTAFAIYSNACWKMQLFSTCGVGTVGLLIAVLGGPVAFAAASTAIAVLTSVPQAWRAWKEPGGTALSMTSLLFSMSCSGCWMTYGAANGDTHILLTSSWSMGLMMFIAVRTLQTRPKASGASIEILYPSKNESLVAA